MLTKSDKTAHIKTTAYAHQLVKLIAAFTGESMMLVAERLAEDEWKRLQGGERDKQVLTHPTNPPIGAVKEKTNDV